MVCECLRSWDAKNEHMHILYSLGIFLEPSPPRKSTKHHQAKQASGRGWIFFILSLALPRPARSVWLIWSYQNSLPQLGGFETPKLFGDDDAIFSELMSMSWTFGVP